MKKWFLLVLIIILAAIPFASAFADSDTISEEEEWFMIRMETQREYIQKLLDAELISEDEAQERLDYLDERIADVLENGFEMVGSGPQTRSHENNGWGHHSGFGHNRFGGGFGYGHGYCH